MKTLRAFTGLEVMVALAVLGALTWAVAPQMFPGASRRAKDSGKATAAVEQTTAAVDRATAAQGGAVAAGLTQIGTANAAAPASPSRDFVGREVPHLLTMLPAPSPADLLAAESRRVAVMEGRAEEARRLYETAAARAAALQSERDAALAARDTAQAERRAVDEKLVAAAAAEHARTVQLGAALLLAAVLGAGWLWLKFHSVGKHGLAVLANDLRDHPPSLAALDSIVDERLKPGVRNLAKILRP